MPSLAIRRKSDAETSDSWDAPRRARNGLSKEYFNELDAMLGL